MAVFLEAWLDLAGPGGREGRATLDWRWACHLEMGTEVWKWPEAAGSRRE